MDSFQRLTETKSPPPKSAFFSNLRGDNIQNQCGLSDYDYNQFVKIWNELKIDSLYTMVLIYSSFDASLTLDIISFYFDYLYKLCNIYPSYYGTCAGYAINSALFNSRSPDNHRLKLEIPYLTEEFDRIFSKGLRGGFCISNSNYTQFSNLKLTKHPNDPPDNHVRICSLIDVNSLYPSSISSYCPYDNFILLTPFQNKNNFDYVSEKVFEGDIEFFHDQLIYAKTMYFCEVETTHHKNAELLITNLDLSVFPFYEQVSLDMLSQDQLERAKRISRNPAKEPKKLVSYLKTNNTLSDFIENILYCTNLLDVKITKVNYIVKCRAAKIFNPWVTKLQSEKNKNPSPILNKIIKNLSNSIPGKS